MKRKLIVVLMLMIFLSSVIIPTHIERVEASVGAEEIELDNQWMYGVLENLSNIVKNNKTHGIYKGRYFGSEGEQYSAYKIKSWMENNSNNLNAKVYLDPVGDDTYTGEDEKIQNRTNNLIDILEYGFKFSNGTVTATVPNNETFPLPKFISGDLPVWVNSTWDGVRYHDVDFAPLNVVSNELSNPVEMSYILLDNVDTISEDFSAEVVIIDDYSTASANDTTNKVHLLEFMTNENDDVYMDKIDKVIDSNGAGFIIVSTNPTFIKNLSISAFGIAISPEDGTRIKNCLNDNKSVVITFSEDNLISTSGTLYMYAFSGKIGDKKIGLIEETSDYPPGWLIPLSTVPIKRSRYVGFILCNTTSFDTTHYLMTATSAPHSFKNIDHTVFSWYTEKPVFFLNQTIHLDGGGSVDLWDWAANDTDLKAEFWIKEQINESVESYNVFCEVPGKNPNKSIMISGGHHDYFWGQGAADDAVGTATMLGVLKYLNDNKITPECNLTFVSWAGEEVIVRGSAGYVFNKFNYRKNENITYMINLDFFAFDSPESPLDIFTSTKSFELAIKNITQRTNYKSETGYDIEIEHNLSSIADDAGPFKICYVDDSLKNKLKFLKKKTDLQIVTIGRENIEDIVRHRSGGNHEFGDVLDHIDQDDLNCTADIVLNITKYLAWEPPENEFVNCSFTPFDLSGNGWNDSVNISFNVTTNLTSWATVKACLYNVTTSEAVSDVYETSFTIYKDQNISGYLTPMLPYSKKNDTYNASIWILDDHNNIDDECYQHMNLTPYSLPIADFTYVSYFNQNRIWFFDASTPSPGGTINSWNWSFGDGTYSEIQNTMHKYDDDINYVVNLTVWDSNNLNDTVSKTIAVPNVKPHVSFSVNNNVVVVGKSISFTQTCNDSDGSIVNYTWNFGDGNYSYSANTSHSYYKSGFYTVALTVIDDDNATNTTTKTNYLVVADALVDDGFTDDPTNHKWDSIQEGINDVGNDSIIYVYNGVYQSYLVNKSVSIYGESKELVLVIPQPIGIDVQCHDVYIKNCTIDGGVTGVNIISTANGTGNTTIENVVILGPIGYGVYIDNSSNNTINGCSVANADVGIKICNGAKYNVIDDCNISKCYHGVGVYSSSYNWIGNPSINESYPNDCVFTGNDNAVYLDESDRNYVLGCEIDATPPPNPGRPPGTRRGIYLDESSNTTISTCNIFNGTQGIYIKDSRDNKVGFCRIIENDYGIECFGSDAEYNLIVQNNITNNSVYGVYLPPFPKVNKVLYNDFFDNGNGQTNQSYDGQTDMQYGNKWYKQGPNTLMKKDRGEGNYWNDYTGNDFDSDGIGDTEYGVEGGGEDDDYPVMEAYGWCTGTSWE